MVREGAARDVEMTLLAKSGERIPVVFNGSVIRDDEGQLLAVMGVARDMREIRRLWDEIQRADATLRSLNAAALAVQRALQPEDVFRAVASELRKFGFHTVIFLLDEDQRNLMIAYTSFSPELIKRAEKLTGLRVSNIRFPLDRIPQYIKEVLGNRVTVFSQGKERIEGFLPAHLRGLAGKLVEIFGAQKGIVAPLVVGGEAIGALVVDSQELTENDVPAITAFANQVSIALENARLYEQAQQEIAQRKRAEEEIRRRNEELAALNAISQAMTTTLDPTAIMQTVAEGVVTRLGYDGSLISLYSEKEKHLSIVAVYPHDDLLQRGAKLLGVQTDSIFRFALDPAENHGFARLSRGEVWLSHRFHDFVRPWVSQPVADALQRLYGSRSYICVPLWTKDERVGSILAATKEEEISQQDQEALLAVARQAAVAVENARLYEQARQEIAERVRAEEALRESKERLRTVVTGAPIFLFALDREGVIQFAEGKGLDALGFKPDEVVGRSASDIYPDVPQVVEAIHRALAGEEVTSTAEVAGVWIEARLSPLRDENGQLVGVIGVSTDVTERKWMEAQVVQSAKMASLGVMAGGIAHEVRNPLGIASAAAQLLLDQPEDEQLRAEAARRIHAAIQRASQIIEGLLRFARPPREGVTPVDINQALEETVALVANQIKVGRVRLQKHLAEGLPPLQGNKNLLQQAFLNLILNACNAMPDGGRLTITTRVNSGNQVEIQFADTGCGIPKESLSAIFDPFFTTMPVGKGVGLGLSISYSIIKQHRGKIDVESKVGVGSTFTVRLPGAMDEKEG